jgi:hypothetical protein
MGYLWKVFGYVPPGGTQSVIADWVSVVDDWRVLAKFDSRLLHLCQLPRDKWKHDHAHTLHGEGGDLFELLFNESRVAYRPLCTMLPERMAFAILFFATERNDRLRPPEAIATAQQRRMELESGRATRELYDKFKP